MSEASSWKGRTVSSHASFVPRVMGFPYGPQIGIPGLYRTMALCAKRATDMIRRYGCAPEAGRAYTRRPGAYAILPRAGSLLLTFQAEPLPELQLPGGGIDAGENPVR